MILDLAKFLPERLITLCDRLYRLIGFFELGGTSDSLNLRGLARAGGQVETGTGEKSKRARLISVAHHSSCLIQHVVWVIKAWRLQTASHLTIRRPTWFARSIAVTT